MYEYSEVNECFKLHPHFTISWRICRCKIFSALSSRRCIEVCDVANFYEILKNVCKIYMYYHMTALLVFRKLKCILRKLHCAFSMQHTKNFASFCHHCLKKIYFQENHLSIYINNFTKNSIQLEKFSIYIIHYYMQ